MDKAQLAKECVAIDEAGGNVREYLASKGFISPWGTWYRLQIEELGRSKNQITEGKGGNDMKRVTLEQKKKAVEIALGGGDPLAYLKSIGSKQPPALWYAIRKGLQDADPDTFEKLMLMKKYEEPETTTGCDQSTRKGVEVPDEIPEEKQTEQLTVKSEDLKAVMEAPVSDAKDVRPGIVSKLTHDASGLHTEAWRPLDKMGIKVTGLITPFGEFQTGGGMMAWYKDGNLIADRTIEEWKKLLETLPVVMEIMNI